MSATDRLGFAIITLIIVLVLCVSLLTHDDAFAQQQNFSNPTTGSGSTVLSTSPTINTPNLNGLTNGTGLQVFNTTTTCTTAATISTPCTTAAITLPVAYADTNYRLVCTGLSPTAFPQLQTVTKLNTTFTITLNNLTAAAATYTSFDCLVGHN